MGFFDKITTNNVAKGNIKIEAIHKAIAEKLGNKYEVKLQEKGSNVLSRAMSGNHESTVLVAKNAYHRTLLSVYYDQINDETYINLNEATVKGWLRFLYKQAGLIGSFIIDLCYGKGLDFYSDVTTTIKQSFNTEERQINTGLSALWSK